MINVRLGTLWRAQTYIHQVWVLGAGPPGFWVPGVTAVGCAG
jgi:hypothetical protein